MRSTSKLEYTSCHSTITFTTFFPTSSFCRRRRRRLSCRPRRPSPQTSAAPRLARRAGRFCPTRRARPCKRSGRATPPGSRSRPGSLSSLRAGRCCRTRAPRWVDLVYWLPVTVVSTAFTPCSARPQPRCSPSPYPDRCLAFILPRNLAPPRRSAGLRCPRPLKVRRCRRIIKSTRRRKNVQASCRRWES